MKRIAIYVRVSTEEQAETGLSVDSQIVALKAFCKDNGYIVEGVYNDAGISARKSYKKRPALLQMIAKCQAGKIDLVCFTKLDRFFRSVSDYYECINQMNGVPWRAIWEDYETETANGIFKVNIMLSVAQSEADRTSERVKAINDYKRAKGEFVGGMSPLGYKIEGKQLVIDEQTRAGIEAFFETYKATNIVMRAIESAEAHGLTISRQRARYIMRSEVYCGNAYGYECPAYITREEHDRIVAGIEGRRSRVGRTGRVYLFSGLVQCECCGSKYAPHYKVHNDKNGRRYHYTRYLCQKNVMHDGCDNGRSISETTIEKYLLAELDKIIEDRKVKAKAEANNEKDSAKRIASLNAKLSRIGIRFEDGDISVEEYREKRDAIQMELHALETETTIAPIDLPTDWHEAYALLDDEHKKGFWAQIVRKIIPKADRTGFEVILN